MQIPVRKLELKPWPNLRLVMIFMSENVQRNGDTEGIMTLSSVSKLEQL
jgi:hypothetical protein